MTYILYIVNLLSYHIEVHNSTISYRHVRGRTTSKAISNRSFMVNELLEGIVSILLYFMRSAARWRHLSLFSVSFLRRARREAAARRQSDPLSAWPLSLWYSLLWEDNGNLRQGERNACKKSRTGSMQVRAKHPEEDKSFTLAVAEKKFI